MKLERTQILAPGEAALCEGLVSSAYRRGDPPEPFAALPLALRQACESLYDALQRDEAHPARRSPLAATLHSPSEAPELALLPAPAGVREALQRWMQTKAPARDAQAADEELRAGRRLLAKVANRSAEDRRASPAAGLESLLASVARQALPEGSAAPLVLRLWGALALGAAEELGGDEVSQIWRHVGLELARLHALGLEGLKPSNEEP